MKILAFDTAMAACSVAVTISGELAGYRHELRDRGHAERLVPMMGEAMAEAGLTYDDLDRIAVTSGPGTFTGVRVGIAAARGLTLATGKPAAAVTTLEALAAGVGDHPGTDFIVTAIDARRGELYVQAFSGGGAAKPLVAASEPAALTPDAAAASLPPGTLGILGTGRDALLEALKTAGRSAMSLHAPAQPDARIIARLGACIEDAAPALTHHPEPLYLRAPDAKLPGGRSAPS